MKKQNFDIYLFGDGSGTASSNATAEHMEQAADKACDDKQNGAFVNGNDTSSISVTQSNGHTTDSAFTGEEDIAKRFAEAIGIESLTGEELISALNLCKKRVDLEKRLLEKGASGEYEKLISQANRLSSEVDGFDLEKELFDKRFVRLISCGFSIEEAYNAVHSSEIKEKDIEIAKRMAMDHAVAEYIKNGNRPSENGINAESAVSTKTKVENLTGRGIRDILSRVEKGAKIKF